MWINKSGYIFPKKLLVKPWELIAFLWGWNLLPKRAALFRWFLGMELPFKFCAEIECMPKRLDGLQYPNRSKLVSSFGPCQHWLSCGGKECGTPEWRIDLVPFRLYPCLAQECTTDFSIHHGGVHGSTATCWVCILDSVMERARNISWCLPPKQKCKQHRTSPPAHIIMPTSKLSQRLHRWMDLPKPVRVLQASDVLLVLWPFGTSLCLESLCPGEPRGGGGPFSVSKVQMYQFRCLLPMNLTDMIPSPTWFAWN